MARCVTSSGDPCEAHTGRKRRTSSEQGLLALRICVWDRAGRSKPIRTHELQIVVGVSFVSGTRRTKNVS